MFFIAQLDFFTRMLFEQKIWLINLMPLILYRSGRKVPDFFADPIGRISQDTGLADFVQRISRSVS